MYLFVFINNITLCQLHCRLIRIGDIVQMQLNLIRPIPIQRQLHHHIVLPHRYRQVFRSILAVISLRRQTLVALLEHVLAMLLRFDCV